MVRFATAFSAALALLSPVLGKPVKKRGPFLLKLNDTTSIIGNDLWNITQGPTYATKLFYKDHDCIGDAVGHYVSYNGAQSNLNLTDPIIYRNGSNFIDIRYTAKEGYFHWVIYSDLPGAYQYFVNRGLPVLGEFRTLFRLDNNTFTHGRTNIKDEPLPPLSWYANSTKVQDETWQRPASDGGAYITKYDWSTFLRNLDYYGLYGDGFGSWYINPGKDEYNGNHLKQELVLHRESATGDAVQLNMIHGTHFQALSSDAFPVGKTWGPWLWYLNDGSKSDAKARANKEFADWPYKWFDDGVYHARGEVSGTLKLSDGRPAAHAAVFLGDNNPNETALDMGRYNYYTGYADSQGRFKLDNVRAGTYGFQAWANGSSIGDVTSTFLKNNVTVSKGRENKLGSLTWELPQRGARLFQVGEFDRYSYGFAHGGDPYKHAVVANCPENLTYTIGESKTSDWCFGQWGLGNWTIRFQVASIANSTSNSSVPIYTNPSAKANAVLTVSLAGYSSGVSDSIVVNGDTVIGNLTSASIPSDPGLYRSATAAGEWHQFGFGFDGKSLLKKGWNEVTFQCTRSSAWHGFMWDAIALDWL